jgi:hypothetical protein
LIKEDGLEGVFIKLLEFVLVLGEEGGARENRRRLNFHCPEPEEMDALWCIWCQTKNETVVNFHERGVGE